MTKTVAVTYSNSDDRAESHIDPSLVAPTGNAEPTGRVLDGSADHGFAEEWAEPAVLPDGRKCRRVYLFDAAETFSDAEQYPWDNAHVARILLAD